MDLWRRGSRPVRTLKLKAQHRCQLISEESSITSSDFTVGCRCSEKKVYNASEGYLLQYSISESFILRTKHKARREVTHLRGATSTTRLASRDQLRSPFEDESSEQRGEAGKYSTRTGCVQAGHPLCPARIRRIHISAQH